MKIITIIMTFFLTYSCGQDNLERRKRDLGYSQIRETASAKTCNCAYELNPVCGSDGKTYNNPCLASCHKSGGYSQGACSCNANSGYLCAQPPMPECPDNTECAQVMPSAKTYADECEMIRANARYIHLGTCQ